ncbi:septal ring lytic transglycosylase RlpA family protein [Tessaracoccus antarcticus]|uniref:Probable endolytic peptidoglycan transglycosylase RlpA n=1 Tax=Tessaracoccus antarcticus TaxID=2479848 RepID=A0A3M0GIM4_9ACTN|nr:septal ring lytic transglycosylase RlpA family protein [Tessaracoccus antarcticus]
MTYLPSGKAAWKNNPLATNKQWTAADGHRWKTECNTAATGKNGCRSYVLSRNVVNTGGKFVSQSAWLFNNMVQFSSKGTPAQTTIPPKAPAVANVPVEKAFKTPVAAAAGGAGGTCSASYYWEGQMTANGERFNTNDLTAAHKTLKFGTRVKVTNPANGKSVVVRINDRGPYVSGRCLDLSKAAMSAIGGISAGHIKVSYQVVS